MAVDPLPAEVLPWLKSLPFAPEYHPTLSEFVDPIAYILKIEKEASAYGICKIVPPLPAAPKKTAVTNLNKSFAARAPNPNPSASSKSKRSSTFSTRHQQIGFCPRRPRPVQKPVWQSGDVYTLSQFEAKAKLFERSYLSNSAPAPVPCHPASKKKKKNKKKSNAKVRQKKSSKESPLPLSPLELETLFWKACADKPFSVEYANDMPGSAFAPIAGALGKRWREEEASNVGETAWNMRGVSRAKGSLLRFMKEEIPGVTSPMVYVAMMFSWFAWHVEDHEFHSLNYLHMGVGKTWYGVPRDAALAFEDVVRVQGYCGEVNPLMTFTILGEKTTVMSPEVLIDAGIPCCRLVQNAGEFVVTFPGAYHCGFSHGFNCGEAANIATPGWLRVAKEAAVRRASTNYPPMVSHFQLLYDLALSLCPRMPMYGNNEPRSCRLKDKMRGEGERMIKKAFVQSVIENNDLLSYLLGKGSSCIVLPQTTSRGALSSSLVRSQVKYKRRLSLGLCSHEEAVEASKSLPFDDILQDRNSGIKQLSGFCSLEGNSVAVYHRKKHTSALNSNSKATEVASSIWELQNIEDEKRSNLHGEGLLDQGLLSCVTCGILSFACIAVVKPREATAQYLMSADCNFFSEQISGSVEISDAAHGTILQGSNFNLTLGSGQMGREIKDSLDDNVVHSSRYSAQVSESMEVGSEILNKKDSSALDLLASAYGDLSSDSDDQQLPHETSVLTYENISKEIFSSYKLDHGSGVATKHMDLWFGKFPFTQVEQQSAGAKCQNAVCAGTSHSALSNDSCLRKLESSRFCMPEHTESVLLNNFAREREVTTSSSSVKYVEGPNNSSCKQIQRSHSTASQNSHRTSAKMQEPTTRSADLSSLTNPYCGEGIPCLNRTGATQSINHQPDIKNSDIPVVQRSDKDSSRMHVFCLEHAVEVERKLQMVGGVNIMLLCHPDYPKFEAEAKALAEELGIDYAWNMIDFRAATGKDHEKIHAALKDEESIPSHSDWAVKLGINLYYSASLSKSPLYCKQMPYNAIIYKAFSCSPPESFPGKTKDPGRSGRQKKVVVSGKWCGRVWMSNQVHPYLAHRRNEHDEEAVGPFSLDDTTSPKLAIRSESKGSSANDKGSVARKQGKRKNMPLQKSNAKKLRPSQSNDSLTPPCENDSISQPDGRILRSSSKLNKNERAEGGPSSRLRQRPEKLEDPKSAKLRLKMRNGKRQARGSQDSLLIDDGDYTCDIEGCSMSFSTKHDLSLHKRDICPVKGCGKKLFSHKYMLQHRKVHMDDRPLECPWKGCNMRFKWSWARTEHMRVHTGDRPYICSEPECGQTFRFVSDFSRHKRKTGHSSKKFRRA